MYVQSHRLIFNNSHGFLTQAQQISIQASNLNNRQGLISQLGGGSMRVAADGGIDNYQGTIVSNGGGTIEAQDINNQGGLLQAAGTADQGVLGVLGLVVQFLKL